MRVAAVLPPVWMVLEMVNLKSLVEFDETVEEAIGTLGGDGGKKDRFVRVYYTGVVGIVISPKSRH